MIYKNPPPPPPPPPKPEQPDIRYELDELKTDFEGLETLIFFLLLIFIYHLIF